MIDESGETASRYAFLRSRRNYRRGLVYLALIAVSIIMLLPTYWMLETALTSTGHEFGYPPKFFPHPIAWDNFAKR